MTTRVERREERKQQYRESDQEFLRLLREGTDEDVRRLRMAHGKNAPDWKRMAIARAYARRGLR